MKLNLSLAPRLSRVSVRAEAADVSKYAQVSAIMFSNHLRKFMKTFLRFHRFSLLPLLVLAMFVSEAATSAQPSVSIVTGSAPGPGAKHGLEKIISVLKQRNVSFEQTNSVEHASGKSVVIVGLAGDAIFSSPTFKTFRDSVPTNAEALAIQKLNVSGKSVLAIAGSDHRGLMYAELDVANRIDWITNAEAPFSEVRDTIEKPEVATRALSLFTMNRAYWESRFYDEAYWQRYLDTLAENRFNSFIVIFGYENGGFLAPCYPYFFDTPEFPEVKMVGITPEQQKKNIEAFTHLIEMAHARGINFSVGIWDHIYRGAIQNGEIPEGNAGLLRPTPGLVWGMNATNLVPYTQVALKRFLKQFPGIDGIQFRMHDESGLKNSEQAGFWRETFRTVKETVPNMPVELRAKGLTSVDIQNAMDAGLNFCINTKFWMEQMGLPFHPTHVNPQDQRSRRHGYADMLVYPQQYKVKWQLWNGGTSRIFLWGDPDYTRRFVEATHLYDGDSFEVYEPLTTKMEAQPHDAKPFDLLKPSARYYDYEFERYWHFFQVFGRIGYNPRTPAEVWDREFAKRFGPDAGPILENALHRASWILPRIIASSIPYNTGFPMTTGWPERQYYGDLPTFAKATLSDVQLFENFDDEAKLIIEGGETAKVRPQETSRWLAQVAAEINMALADAEKTIGSHRNKEFDSTVLDLKMLANLALYHSRRIPAAVSYRLFERSKDPTTLDDAITCECGAIAAWRQMAETAGDTYASDLLFGAQKRDLTGHWRDDLPAMEKALAELEQQRNGISTNTISNRAPRYEAFANEIPTPAVMHQPVTRIAVGQPLTIRAKVSAPSGIKWVQVLYRSVDQTRNYETLEMKAVDDQGNYEAVIPAGKIVPRFDFMYFIQAMDNQHHGIMYPDFNQQAPYFVVQLER
jgi:hypothetical protein